MELNNLIFTLVVTVLAALLGLTYPLFMQIIQRIDDKYDSTLLVKTFKEEWTYKVYNVLLITTFITTLYLPFAPACNCLVVKDMFIIQHSAHLLSLLCLLLLVIYLIKLSKLIWVYNDPQKLYAQIVKNNAIIIYDEKLFSQYLDLYVYAIEKVKNDDLRIICNQKLVDSFVEFRKNRKNKVLVYPNNLYLALSRIIDSNCKLKSNTSLMPDTSFAITLLLDEWQHTLVSEYTLSFIWNSINKFLIANKNDWIIQYWAIANQYCNFILDERRQSELEDFKNERKRFVNMHYAMGGLIMYKKKYGLLKELMTFSNHLPPEYFLVPNTFAEIIDIIINFNNIRIINPFFFEKNYPFIGVNKGANESDFIMSWIMQYLAIVYLRLFLPIYHSRDVQERPEFGETIEDNESLICIVESLEHWISEFNSDERKKKELLPIFDMESKYKNSADIFLQKLKKEITEKNDSLKKNFNTSTKKVEEFKKAVTSNVLDLLAYYPSEPADNTQSFAQKKITPQVYTNVEHDIFAIYSIRSFSNLDSLLVSQLSGQLSSAYSLTFLLNSSVAKFRVEYRDILTALDKLSLCSDFVVISLGISLGNLESFGTDANKIRMGNNRYKYGDLDIYYINSSRRNALIVLKKEDLPYASIQESSVKTDIEDKNSRYQINISFEATIYSKDFFKFVQINVISSLFDGLQPTLEQIKPITNYIV